MSRRKDRSDRANKYEDAVRISLLEDDMNDMETMFEAVRTSQERIVKLLWSTLSALLVATILLAINLSIDRIPPPGG